MGLDLYLNAKLKNKRTGAERSLPIMYWRKAFGIRDLLVELAQKFQVDSPNSYGDVYFDCSLAIVPILKMKLLDAMKINNHEYWTRSIWTATETRCCTLNQLGNLIAFEDWLCGDCDNETLFDELSELEDERSVPLEGNPEDYEIIMEVVNSY